MSNIYCSSCGSKHILGAKFCSACGNALSMQAIQNSRSLPIQMNKPQEIDDEGLPTTFRKPSRLSYEVDKGGRNKFSVNEIISQPPSNEKFQRPVGNAAPMTKEEYLAQSLKECRSTREFKDINE